MARPGYQEHHGGGGCRLSAALHPPTSGGAVYNIAGDRLDSIDNPKAEVPSYSEDDGRSVYHYYGIGW